MPGGNSKGTTVGMTIHRSLTAWYLKDRVTYLNSVKFCFFVIRCAVRRTAATGSSCAIKSSISARQANACPVNWESPRFSSRFVQIAPG